MLADDLTSIKSSVYLLYVKIKSEFSWSVLNSIEILKSCPPLKTFLSISK